MIDTNCNLIFNNKKIKLNLSFDIVLKIQSLFMEQNLSGEDKIDIALYLLVRNARAIKGFDFEQKTSLLNIIYSDFINVKGNKSKSNKTVLDFNQDAKYIYSSFMMDYGIDLSKECGRLDWRKFIALFQGLSESTKIREIMAIRGRDIPKANDYNQAEIKALEESQAFYALDTSQSNKSSENNFEAGVNELGSILFAQV